MWRKRVSELKNVIRKLNWKIWFVKILTYLGLKFNCVGFLEVAPKALKYKKLSWFFPEKKFKKL